MVNFLPSPDRHWLRFVVEGAQPTAQPAAMEESVWNAALDAKLQKALEQVPAGSNNRWVKIASIVGPKSAKQCKGRAQADARSKAVDAKLQEALEQVPAGTYDRWFKITSIVRPKSATQYTGHAQAAARSNAAEEHAAERSKAPEQRRQKDGETDEDAHTRCDLALAAVLEQATALSALREKVANGASTSTDDINRDLYTILAPKNKARSEGGVDPDELDGYGTEEKTEDESASVSGTTRATWRSYVQKRVKCQRRYLLGECLGT